VNRLVNFLKLIQNENMKIYRRVRTWIMLGIIALLPPLVSILIYAVSDGNESMTNWAMMLNEAYILNIFITIFSVVIAAEAVAGEFTWGTIKLLLIRPWSRSAILLSKYLSMLIFALLCSVLAFVVTLVVNILVFGYSDNIGDLAIVAGNQDTSPWVVMIEFYALQFVSLIIIVTFGFMISSAFRSSGLAIGIAVALLFAGNIITGLFALAQKVWVKYVLFMHLDLTSYMSGGNGPIPGYPTTLGFSLGVLAIYFVIFNLISWIVFNKRDVAA